MLSILCCQRFLIFLQQRTFNEENRVKGWRNFSQKQNNMLNLVDPFHFYQYLWNRENSYSEKLQEPYDSDGFLFQ